MSQQSDYYDFQKVLDAVQFRIDELVHHLLPGAKRQGGSYRCGDASGERGSSFSISTKANNAGCFIDHSDPSVSGNAIGLWAITRNLSYQEAGEALAKFLGVSPEVRLHLPKKRPKPRIHKDDTGRTRTFEIGGRTETLHPLNHRSVAYALGRGITEATLKRAQCTSTDSDIIFPHFDEEGEVCMLKTWSCDGQKRIFSNTDPVPTLFGKPMVDPIKSGSTLIITEGHWDALTWQQLGYPAVSIPNGVSNDEWIGEDWNFLNCFSTIYLDFDSDAKGQEAELKAKVRLGMERCRSIHYRFKDANAALQAGEADVLEEAYRHARDAPIERIIQPESIREKVRQRLSGHSIETGVPFFLPSVNFHFRPHENTVWYGLTSHGKSSILSNQICYSASLGEKSFVASFEQDSPMTVAGMLAQYTADGLIGDSSDYNAAYNHLMERVLFFDSMARANPKEIISTIILAHKQLGVSQAVVDNVMTLEVDRQDNTAQAEVADSFRVLTAQLPIHLHLVMHPRKPPSSEASKPPSIADIMGASEWSAMAHNIICVWRDVAKAQKLSEMRDEQMDPMDIMTFDQSTPDGKVFWRKQRKTGELPMVSYFYDGGTKRAYKQLEQAGPYFFADGAHEATEAELHLTLPEES